MQGHTTRGALGTHILRGCSFQGATSALTLAVTALGRFPGKLHAQPWELGQTFFQQAKLFYLIFDRKKHEEKFVASTCNCNRVNRTNHLFYG